MKKDILFIQPIVSHYRKSVVEEITKLAPGSTFWGTDDFQGVEPLKGLENVDNSFEIKRINVFGVKFVWYKKMITRFIKEKNSHIVLSGVNPLLINTFIVFFIIKVFTNKKVFWWSQGKPFKQGYLGKRIRYLFYKYSNGVFLYSKKGKEDFIKEGLPSNKLYVINNSLNYEDYGWLNYNLEKKTNNNFRVVYTGRLSARKKVIILIEAIRILKEKGVRDITLDIVGEGDQMATLVNYVKKNKINDLVNFHGAKYGKDVHEYLLKADLAVCPGAVGLSIVHALSFGLPFITSKGDPNHSSELELLKPEINGGYFTLDNAESLAKVILKWQDRVKKDKYFYTKECIKTVEDFEYMPNLVAEKLINSI